MQPFMGRKVSSQPPRQDAILITDDDPKKSFPIHCEEALSSRNTFFVDFSWDYTPHDGVETRVHGKMYVESLRPAVVTQKYPIVLIHGDYYTGQIWLNKPDGKPGWASDLLNAGYLVYIVDLPLVGRSNFISAKEKAFNDSSLYSNTLSTSLMENELTAPADVNSAGWPNAAFHRMWPGSGRERDPIFERLRSSLVALPLDRLERQKMAQNALSILLSTIGKSILLGHGSRATMAWLVTDLRPKMVAAVVAVEPIGPPYGATYTMKGKKRRYSPMVSFSHDNKAYGLADIPLTYYPPAKTKPKGSRHKGKFTPLDVTMFSIPNPPACCILQDDSDDVVQNDNSQPICVRTLVNLQKVPHIVVTSHAGSHSLYDWATVRFMHQAGLSVKHLQLEQFNIRGNGHLMFLEINSHKIAAVLHSQITNTLGTSSTVQPPLTKMEVPTENQLLQPKASETESKQDFVDAPFQPGFLDQNDVNLEDVTNPNAGEASTNDMAFPTDSSFLECFDDFLHSNEIEAVTQFYDCPSSPSQMNWNLTNAQNAVPKTEDTSVAVYSTAQDGPPVAVLQPMTQDTTSPAYEPYNSGGSTKMAVPVQPEMKQEQLTPMKSGDSAELGDMTKIFGTMRAKDIMAALKLWTAQETGEPTTTQSSKLASPPPSAKKDEHPFAVSFENPQTRFPAVPAPPSAKKYENPFAVQFENPQTRFPAAPEYPTTSSSGNLPSPDTPSTMIDFSWFNELGDVDYNTFNWQKYKDINGSPTPSSKRANKRMRRE